MNEEKTAGMIGLAVRSRQVSTGMEACRILVRTSNCGVMLLDQDTGPNTRKKAEELCIQAGAPIRVLPPGTIEKATGKSNKIIAVQKGSIAEQILKLTEG